MNPERTAMPYRRRHDTQDFNPTESAELRAQILEARAAAGALGTWVLESKLGEDGQIQRTPLNPLPFRIGRANGLQMVLPSSHVSKAHAEIYSDGLTLRIRDLDSRNGTFLNRESVRESVLHDGDVVHIGDFEFRVSREFVVDDCPDAEGTVIQTAPLSRHFIAGATKIRQLIDEGAVTMLFQPVVTLPGGKAIAYEALGRGSFPGLPESPVELFEFAGGLGPEVQAELSRLFRRKAVELVKNRPEAPLLFVNTHPVELERGGLLLLQSLEQLRSYAPNVDLVLEIHESALAQTDFILWLRTRLREINVGLAYDDFGAGQARLFELAEAPPDYLKFDRRFVTGLETAPVTRQRLVASLVAAARELLVKTIAEGVETPEEAAACVRAGFSHAQGYHFARPAAIEQLVKEQVP